jgi:hypothetical protein
MGFLTDLNADNAGVTAEKGTTLVMLNSSTPIPYSGASIVSLMVYDQLFGIY